jgi:pre-mRNA-splicing factor ISY1
MARNQEKANLMFNRWTSMKEELAVEERTGGRRSDRRPYLASEVKVLPEAEKWRRQVIADVMRKVQEIQNAGLGEARIRDLNDEINKLLREKGHWERQIKALGGPDYATTAPKIADADGRELPGARGYKYFGAARDLPGVKELFAKAVEANETGRLRRGDIVKGLTPDYYGFRDEDDGVLMPLEAARSAELRAALHEGWIEEQRDAKRLKAAGGAAVGSGAGAGAGAGSGSGSGSGSAVPIPLSDVETLLAARRKQILLDKYASQALVEEQAASRALLQAAKGGGTGMGAGAGAR